MDGSASIGRPARLPPAVRRPDWPTRDGRTAPTRCSMPTGRMATSPIALVEVAGLRVRGCDARWRRSRRGAATTDAARALARAGGDIRARSRNALLDGGPERSTASRSTAAAALCRVQASNAGHLLYTGLAAPERAAQVMERLLAGDVRFGLGLRTLARDQHEFQSDVVSQRVGVAARHRAVRGRLRALRQQGRRRALAGRDVPWRRAFLDAHAGAALRICATAGEPPIAYPVACLPQAWSAGAVFMLLQACLGVSIDAFAARGVHRPTHAAARDRPARGTRARRRRVQRGSRLPAHGGPRRRIRGAHARRRAGDDAALGPDRRTRCCNDSPCTPTSPPRTSHVRRRFYEDKVGLRPKQEIAGGIVYEFGKGTACFLYPTPNAGTSRASQAFWRSTTSSARSPS